VWFLGLLPGFWCLPLLHPKLINFCSSLFLSSAWVLHRSLHQNLRGKNCDPFQNKIRSGTWYGFPWRRQPYGFPWRRQPSIQVILSQPCPAIWQSGERHLGGKVFVESVKKLLLFLDWRYKIQNCPPVISSSYVLWFHGWFAQSLYDKIRHLLIAQHIPKACVRIDEQARQLMIYGHRPRLENPNSGLTGCRSQFGQGLL